MKSILRRLAVIFCCVLATAALMAAALAFAFRANFPHSAPPADYPAATSPLEAQRQDLDYFAKAAALDRSFSPPARATAEARIAELKSEPQAMAPAVLHVALMQVMALADNGHSRMRATGEGVLVLPVRVTRFAEGFYVMRAEAVDSDLLGGRVEAIDGLPFDEILARLETLRGGVEGFRRENASTFIVVQDLLYGLGIAKEPRASTWTVRLADGRLVTRRLDAYALRKGETLPRGSRWLSPEPPREGVERTWIAYQPKRGGLPETWRQFDTHFRIFQAPGSCADVVRLQDIADTDGQEIAPFLSSTQAELKRRAPCALILDLRYNGGGDYTKTWRFAHALPGLLGPQGRIFVLTDPDTFSAAITTAAFVKQAGGKRVTIVGEPVGDRLAFFSEGGEACLPNLKVCVDYQVGKHDYAHPCTDWRECYWLNWLFPVRVTSLQPDVLVPRRFEDWNAGRDAAFARTLELVSAR